MIKAAFFDIDGTLLDHSGERSVFPKSTKAALTALQRKGIKVLISTGRSPAMLGSVGRDLPAVRDLFPFDGFCTFNGQLVLERDGSVIHRLAHDPQEVLRFISLAKQHGLKCFVLEDELSFPITDCPEIRQHYEWMGVPCPPFYDSSRLTEHPVIQFNIFLPLEKGMKILAPLEHIEITSSGFDVLDIIPNGGGKETGLSAVAKHYGILQEETIAFGDGLNDVGMLRWAGVGVAMGNALDEVKKEADYVTTPVSDDGVKNALVGLGVLDEGDFCLES